MGTTNKSRRSASANGTASGSGNANRRKSGTKNARRTHVAPLLLFAALILALGGILLAACMRANPSEPSAPDVSDPVSDPLPAGSEQQESSEPEASKTVSSSDVIYLIDPDAEPSEDDVEVSEPAEEISKPATEVSKDTTSKDPGTKPVQPIFEGGTVIAPITPDSGYVDIRSVTTPEKNKLVLVGVDTEDPGVAEGIAQLEELYASYKKTTGFFAYSLDGKRAIAWNCENEFFSACTVKTGFILYCCLAIDQGLVDKDTVMYYEAKYYHGGSGYIKNVEYGTSFTIERLIYLSLNVSDNIAYEMLTAFFGHDGYNQMMEDFGCERLKLDKSIWSYRMNAHDLAILWRELYFYFQSDSYMANLYRKATFNTKYNYATKYIEYDYNHKSGDSQASHPVINDGTIIWAEHPYVVAILNSSMGERADDVAVASTVKIINDYIIDGPTLSESAGTDS